MKRFYSYVLFILLLSIAWNQNCTNPNACNYNPDAFEDDGSCLYDDCLGECGGDDYECCPDGDNCPIDCTGCLGGDAVIDECGNCVEGTTTDEIFNCGSSPCIYNWDMDCTGECGGDSQLDECGICEGDAYAEDCVGTDDCENMDCAGNCDANLVLDNCGVCGGENADLDCEGNCFGDAYFDECGE